MSTSDDYNTPPWLTEIIGPVDLDPCSNEYSTVRATSKVQLPYNGLADKYWRTTPGQRIFINPPYSDVGPWVARAAEAVRAGASVWLLLKLEPTTKWAAALDAIGTFGPSYYVFNKRLSFYVDGKEQRGNNFGSMLCHVGSVQAEDRTTIRMLKASGRLHRGLTSEGSVRAWEAGEAERRHQRDCAVAAEMRGQF